ncbi:DUF4097 family beta strand repeat-containing protein [Paenibacillus tarimensis]|uniref:DUF4097 family beta strand repeat-containing protein n=1 Tax=Paenibacillus tarimensis TaxID=416012 RepID=UPI001F2E9D42|nr:DUF4097 family beta strand repeat-containing protein [Paenibacillus tarimensis]MCF2945915.1 DUF4097 domain-containing protein [Paenibacillus tarimensis]
MSGKNRLTATLLSFLIPGAGQLYIGRLGSGLALLVATVMAVAAIVFYAGTGGGRHVLLIVYLGLAVPVLYFLSVYSILQATSPSAADSHEEETGGLSRLQGFGLIAAGVLLLIFVRPGATVSSWLAVAGDYMTGGGLLLIGVLLVLRRESYGMYRLGRVTAALVIITVGALLLWDHIAERNHIALLGRWWPIALIALGAEVVAAAVGMRRSRKRLAFDMGGILLAVVIAVAAYGVTQFSGLPFKWIDQWKAEVGSLSGYTEEKGRRYEKELVIAPWDESVASVVISNPNGKVIVREGDVQEVQVKATVWVDLDNAEEADRIAEKSIVEITGSDKMTIEAKGEPYGTNGAMKPRMNLTVTFPRMPDEVTEAPGAVNETEEGQGAVQAQENETDYALPDGQGEAAAEPEQGERAAVNEQVNGGGSGEGRNAESAESAESAVGFPNTVEQPAETDSEQSGSEQPGAVEEEAPSGLQKMSITVLNGPVEVAGVRIAGKLTVENTNGEIKIQDTGGSVKASTKNGGIQLLDIAGDIEASTFNGKVEAVRVEGEVSVNVTNGGVMLQNILGRIEAETKNGEILITEAASAVNADTLNGRIVIKSSTVGGNWDVGSAVGEIELYIPDNGSYTVQGSVTFGSIETDLPLEVSKKTIQGQIGEGAQRININANSSISVYKYQL